MKKKCFSFLNVYYFCWSLFFKKYTSSVWYKFIYMRTMYYPQYPIILKMFKMIYHYFMYTIFCLYLYTCNIHGGQKWTLDLLALQGVVSYHVGAAYWTWTLYKINNSLNHWPIPPVPFLDFYTNFCSFDFNGWSTSLLAIGIYLEEFSPEQSYTTSLSSGVLMRSQSVFSPVSL